MQNMAGTVGWLILPGIVAGALVGASAELKPEISTEFYAVTGRSAGRILDEMLRLGPMKDGRRFFATTDWDLAWSYDFSHQKDGWHLKNFTTKVTITSILPKWTGTTDSSLTLSNQWIGFYAALKNHEQGHRDIAMAAASEMEKAARGMPAFASRNDLRNTCEKKCGDILENFRARESDYDKQTDHGAKQGARFP